MFTSSRKDKDVFETSFRLYIKDTNEFTISKISVKFNSLQIPQELQCGIDSCHVCYRDKRLQAKGSHVYGNGPIIIEAVDPNRNPTEFYPFRKVDKVIPGLMAEEKE